MSTTETQRKAHHTQTAPRVPFTEIKEQGAYVCNSSGVLFRVPEDSLVSGRSPLLEIVSNAPIMMTKVSDDPWVPISKARQLAANADLYIDF